MISQAEIEKRAEACYQAQHPGRPWTPVPDDGFRMNRDFWLRIVEVIAVYNEMFPAAPSSGMPDEFEAMAKIVLTIMPTVEPEDPAP